jgi:hypothetical protein
LRRPNYADVLAREYRAAIPDPDDAKAILPEYENGIGTKAVHEESSRLSGRVMGRLLVEGDNLILPRVGASLGSVSGYVARLKDWGYEVDLLHVNVPEDEAYRRMIGRFLATNRLISADYFLLR